jgi:hypothetical protein
MASINVLKRVGHAHQLILDGESKRNAYRIAHVDSDTYLAYVDSAEFKEFFNHYKDNSLISGDTEKTTKSVDDKNIVVKSKRGRPRKLEMKKQKLELYLEPKYIEKLSEEASAKGLPVRLHAASYIVEILNNKYKELNS